MKTGIQRAVGIVTCLVIFFSLVACVHCLLQKPRVYAGVAKVVKNYDHVTKPDGSWEAKRVAKPFVAPNDDNLLKWDAEHYNNIRCHLYERGRMWVGDYAFYPLFPLVWRVLGVGSIGISIVNLLLFMIGMTILVLTFGDGLPGWSFPLALCLPMASVFVMPYSESLFFVGIASGICGLLKKRYWLYFVGFFAAMATRSAGSILVPAWIVTDILSAMHNRWSFRRFVSEMSLHLAPVIAGIFAVMLFQHLRGAEHWFEFVVAQREWGKSLSLPHFPLTEWSAESKSVSFPLLYMLLFPALFWLAWLCRRGNADEYGPFDEWMQVRCLSVLYFVGNVMVALLTQHGCVNSLARYLTCTPFFTFMVLDLSRRSISRRWLYAMTFFVAVTVVLCVKMFTRMDSLGVVILLLTAVVVFFNSVMPRWLCNALIGLNYVICIYWTAYLFNTFLAGGWLYT